MTTGSRFEAVASIATIRGKDARFHFGQSEIMTRVVYRVYPMPL